MQQQEEESLEDYVERMIFLKGILEDYIDMLNLMVVGDVSQKSFVDIVELFQKYSRSKSKAGKG
ncbi:unnamed protein product, partial [Adineta steineri]